MAKPFAELVRLAWPITVSTISYSLMTLTSTWFVAHGTGASSASAVAGVGLAGIVSFTILCFSIGLLRGVKILVSQAVGAHRPRQEIDGYLTAGVIIGLLSGALTIAIGHLVAPFLGGLAQPEAAVHAATYLRIRVFAAPLVLVFAALRETRYGEGDAAAPMRASIVGNLVNIGLDALLVFGLHWGVAGAALASVVGNAVEMGSLLRGMWRRLGQRAALAARMAAVWRLGMPTGVQFIMEVGSFFLLTTMISRMSERDMAAHQAVLQLSHLSFLPAHAIAEASSVLAGQAVGARRDDLVAGVARRAMFVAGVYAAGCTVIFAIGAPWLASAFFEDVRVTDIMVRLIHVSTIFLVADAANVVARGVLRGTGDVRFPAVIGVATAWAMTPPLTYLLGERLRMGAVGGWIGLTGEIFLGAALFWLRLGRGSWRSASARSRAAREAAEDRASHPAAAAA